MKINFKIHKKEICCVFMFRSLALIFADGDPALGDPLGLIFCKRPLRGEALSACELDGSFGRSALRTKSSTRLRNSSGVICLLLAEELLEFPPPGV